MKCENCLVEHDGSYGSGRFCSAKCARGFSTKNNRDKINKSVSESMSGRKLSAKHISAIEKSNNFNRKDKTIRNCMDCHSVMKCLPSDKRKFCTSKCWMNYTEKNKEPFELYREKCSFKFSLNDYPDKFDMKLVEELGWYSPSNKKNNLDGVSRDHMISVKEGFINDIDPAIISHPANCNLIQHRKNQSKRAKSSITIEELLERIARW
jgi:hypothetical protein